VRDVSCHRAVFETRPPHRQARFWKLAGARARPREEFGTEAFAIVSGTTQARRQQPRQR